MIVRMQQYQIPESTYDALEERSKRYRSEEIFRPSIGSPGPTKIEFRTVVMTLPFLFLSGVFTGIGIMLVFAT